MRIMFIKILTLYLLAEDGADGPLHLGRVLDIHRPHMRFTDVHLSIGVLRGQLRRESRG